MSQAEKIKKLLLTKLENTEEHASEDVLKKVDEAVLRVIKHYHNGNDADTDKNQNQYDMEFLMVHPMQALLSFHKQLKIDQSKTDSLYCNRKTLLTNQWTFPERKLSPVEDNNFYWSCSTLISSQFYHEPTFLH